MGLRIYVALFHQCRDLEPPPKPINEALIKHNLTLHFFWKLFVWRRFKIISVIPQLRRKICPISQICCGSKCLLRKPRALQLLTAAPNFLNKCLLFCSKYSIIAGVWRFHLTTDDMPGIASHIDVLFREQRDYSKIFSNRDTCMPKNAWSRHWIRSIVDTGVLSNNMNVDWHSETWSYTMTPF